MINRQDPAVLTQEKQDASLASFLILIRLLADIFVSPTEHDTRVVNPFYAAAAPSYSAISTPQLQTSSLFHKEGWRSPQIVIFNSLR